MSLDMRKFGKFFRQSFPNVYCDIDIENYLKRHVYNYLYIKNMKKEISKFINSL